MGFPAQSLLNAEIKELAMVVGSSKDFASKTASKHSGGDAGVFEFLENVGLKASVPPVGNVFHKK